MFPSRILLVEPTTFIHTPHHIQAALHSTGFENARFTLLTATRNELYRERLRTLAAEHANLSLRLLDNSHLPNGKRLATLRQHHFTLKAAETLLAEESFDLVAYLMADHILPFFSHPLADRFFPAHRAAGGISGLLFNHNGLRPAEGQRWKQTLKAALERQILSRAVRGGWFRRLAFFDHRCTGEARRKIDPTLFVDGVDPIELQTVDQTEARRRLNLPVDGRVALMFGAISGRKAIDETLDILSREAAPQGPRITLLIGGPVDPPVRPRLEAALARARERFDIVFHDGFVPDCDLPLFFASADFVVCAYRNFLASSGTLLHAAAFGKPAMVSAGGVMEDAVARFGCGEVVRFSDPSHFAERFFALARADGQALEAYRQGARHYAETMDARRYMAQFL